MAEAKVVEKNGKTIKLTISLEDEATSATAAAASPSYILFVDDTKLFQTANLVWVSEKRNTEHGLTDVRLLKLDESQRKKLLRFLGESFQGILEQLTPFLIRLGGHPRASTRRCVAETVGLLMSEVNFIYFKETILNHWALDYNIYMNSSAGLALSVIARNPKYADNVKALVRYWITTSNPNLNWTAMASCAQLTTLWPEDTLKFLKMALKPDRMILLTLAIPIVRQMCRAGTVAMVLDNLGEWLKEQQKDSFLRLAATLIFLEVIGLNHLADNEAHLDNAVDLLLTGLNDRRLTDSDAIRQATLKTLKSWAELSFDSPEMKPTMIMLFQRMYSRAATPRDKERLTFHLERWRRKDDRFAVLAEGLVQ